MADEGCWRKNCDGKHDRYLHPKHNCLMPITPWIAQVRRQHGQQVKNPVVHPLPREFHCHCGKRWLRTTSDIELAHGWRLLA